MSIFGILDDVASILLTMIIFVMVIFKKYVVEEKMKICFADEIIDFETHELYIASFHRMRWEALMMFILAIMGLRAAAIFDQICFTSSMATIMLVSGTIFSFLPEMKEYFEYYSVGKGKYSTQTVNYEDIEMDLVQAIYKSRAIFSGSIIAIFIYSLSIKNVVDPIQSIFVYLAIIAVIFLTYRSAYSERMRSPIFSRSYHSCRSHQHHGI
jgi:hypothetical protein